MAKPDPYLLEPERYPLHTEVALRYSDLDVNRHLNNYYHRSSGMAQASADFTIMVANLNVQFLGEGFYPEPVLCHTGLRALGKSSQTVAQLATQGNRAIAYAETIMVTILGGKPSPHPPHYREQMEPWLIQK